MKKLDVRVLSLEIIDTLQNGMVISKCTHFFGRECLDLGMDDWVSRTKKLDVSYQAWSPKHVKMRAQVDQEWPLFYHLITTGPHSCIWK